MRYANIPRTDLNPSVICLGAADMGGKMSRETAHDVLDAYAAAGGNFLDTAQVYSDWIPGERSRSEKLLGEWMRARGNRQQIILATKGAHPGLTQMDVPRLSPTDIASDIDASLKHLQTDVIDLYWLHRDDPARPVDGIIEALNAQVHAGKIRYFACSNWRTARIQSAQAYAQANGRMGFVANQMLWNVAVMDPLGQPDKTLATMDAEMHALHTQTQMAAVPYSSQANGLFSKLQRPLAARMQRHPKRLLLQVARNLRNWVQARHALYPREANLRQLRVLQEIASARNLSVSQVVLGYVRSQPFPVFPIVGCQNLDQLEDSLRAAEVQLSNAEVTRLNALHG
jgi:aryl-alcohol dehydrogenase-like predicted oxidoreductase